MNRMVGAVALVLVAAIAAAGAWLAVSGGDGEVVVSEPRKTPVAAVFYQWFGYAHDRDNGWPAIGGHGTFHWNDIVFDELITGFVANKPAIGYYASDSDETIAWQLEQMGRAGIDTIIVSWWG